MIRSAFPALLLCCCACPVLAASDCETNLDALAQLQRAHPHQIELVTVATDDIASQHAAIVQRLGAMHMAGYPARAYAAAAPERMNYLIDHGWGGETPRALVIRADGSRIAISGELTAQQLRRIAPR